MRQYTTHAIDMNPTKHTCKHSRRPAQHSCLHTPGPNVKTSQVLQTGYMARKHTADTTACLDSHRHTLRLLATLPHHGAGPVLSKPCCIQPGSTTHWRGRWLYFFNQQLQHSTIAAFKPSPCPQRVPQSASWTPHCCCCRCQQQLLHIAHQQHHHNSVATAPANPAAVLPTIPHPFPPGQAVSHVSAYIKPWFLPP